MSYQVSDITASIDKAMRQVRPAMKGMPSRSAYIASYDDMRRKVAMLLMSIADGMEYFDPDTTVRKEHKAATAVLSQNK